MALKTILVHLADDADAPARVAIAQALAKAHGAHLTALFISRPLDLPVEITGRGASLVYLEDSAAERDALARSLEAEFRATCEARGLSHDWIVEDSEHLDTLARHAHAADLIVVSRGPNRHLEDRVRLRLAEELVMVTGLPILILPPGFLAPAEVIGQRILIGWKPNREAVRAVRDALPLLQRAQRVLLATVRPTSEDAIATLEVAQYLARQEVTVETLDLAEAPGGIGETLLDAAAAHGCDLLVAGAYGHSRLREVLLGGVTRSLFRSATLPLLLSH